MPHTTPKHRIGNSRLRRLLPPGDGQRQAAQLNRFSTFTNKDSIQLLSGSITWVMLVTGLLTCAKFYAPIAPEASLVADFGQLLEGPLAQGNWGAPIGLMGIPLIYSAFREQPRNVALLVAGTSKLVLIGLILSLGKPFLQFQAGLPVDVDTIMVVLFTT